MNRDHELDDFELCRIVRLCAYAGRYGSKNIGFTPMGRRWRIAARAILFASLYVALGAGGRAQEQGFVKIAPEPKSYAWWLRAEFHPFETAVRGIPVSAIQKSWCKATEFRSELFPPEAQSSLKSSGDLRFAVDGSFDGSKSRQTALIGAYQTCTGKRGSFLLVFARRPNKPPTLRFVHAMPDQPFGMVAALPDGTIQVFHCMECDLATKFRWDKAKARFVQLPPDHEDE